MGAGYSAATLKTQLRMAVQRLAMHRNKKSNQCSVDAKALALLLQAKKEESARIRCEALLAERNMLSCMEVVQLMCELLIARLGIITASPTCPPDLEEASASIIYCASRMDVPELKICAEQLASKFGKEWALSHTHNQSGKVNPRILSKLAIAPPSFELVLHTLQDIAATYQVEWKPDLAALEAGIVDHANPEQIGSIAKIPASPPQQQPLPVQQVQSPPQQQQQMPPQPAPISALPPSMPVQQQASPLPPSTGPSYPPTYASTLPLPSATGTYPMADPTLPTPAMGSPAAAAFTLPAGTYPGTLNIVVHRGKNILNLASNSTSDPHDLYLSLTNTATGVNWRSAADPHGGSNPIWYNNPHLPPTAVCHFPFSVQEPTQQIEIQLFQKKKSGAFSGWSADKCLGSVTFYVDSLRVNPGLQWYKLYRSNMEIGYILMGTQYLPLNATVLSQDELAAQRTWQEEEERQRMRMAEEAAAMGQVQMQGHIPGGPSQLPDAVAASSSGEPLRLTDRVESLLRNHAPPQVLSPPHNYDRNLSDLFRSSSSGSKDAGSVDYQPAPSMDRAEKATAALPDASYAALNDGPSAAAASHDQGSGGARRGSKPERKEDHEEPGAELTVPTPSALDQPLSSPLLQHPPVSASGSEVELLDLPSVPTHQAGAARAQGAASGSGAEAARVQWTKGPAAAASAHSQVDDDDELEARFKRLQ